MAFERTLRINKEFQVYFKWLSNYMSVKQIKLYELSINKCFCQLSNYMSVNIIELIKNMVFN